MTAHRYAVALTAALLLQTSGARAEQVQGVGSAPVTKDVDTVRAQAELGAKRDLVRSLLKQQVGADRLGEISPATIESLANQIQASMIIDRQGSRNGSAYQVTITADIDGAWFARLMDDEGIKSASSLAGAQKQLIFVMLDETSGIGQDASKPTAVQTEYDRRSGASFSDRSVSAASDKEKSAASYSDKSAVSGRSSAAAGYSGPYSYGAASARSSVAAASSTKAAAAYSRSTSSIDKADVQAETHDDVHFRQTVTYQAGITQSGPAGSALSGLTGQFVNYGLELADSKLALNSYFKGNIPSYASIQSRPDFASFTRFIASRNAPFLMGGTIAVTDTGKDPATGLFRCNGRLNVTALATEDGHIIGSDEQVANAAAQSFEDCQGQVSKTLAKLIADKVGPQINRYWRGQVRNRQETVAAATQGGDFTLVIRAPSIDMGMQADMFDALGAITGVTKQALLEQNNTQMSFQVSYQGGTPLQIALFQQLRAKPQYSKITPKIEGRVITLCIAACQ